MGGGQDMIMGQESGTRETRQNVQMDRWKLEESPPS